MIHSGTAPERKCCKCRGKPPKKRINKSIRKSGGGWGVQRLCTCFCHQPKPQPKETP